MDDLRYGVISVTSGLTSDSILREFTKISSEEQSNFSNIFYLDGMKFIDLTDPNRKIHYARQVISLMKAHRPITLYLLADYDGFWSEVPSRKVTSKNMELLLFLVALGAPETLILMKIDNKAKLKLRLIDEELVNYLAYLIRKWRGHNSFLLTRKWHNYAVYRKGKKDKRLRFLRSWLAFAKVFLTGEVLVESAGGEPALISDVTSDKMKSLKESLRRVSLKPLFRTIIDGAPLSMQLKTLVAKYEQITDVKEDLSRVCNPRYTPPIDASQDVLATDLYGELFHGNVNELFDKKSIRDPDDKLSFFVWSLHMGMQGINLLLHGISRIRSNIIAEGIQMLTNGIDHVTYGLLHFLLGMKLQKPSQRIRKWGLSDTHIHFTGSWEQLLRELESNLSVDNGNEIVDTIKVTLETLNAIDKDIRSVRNDTPFTHGLTTTTILSKDTLIDINEKIGQLLKCYNRAGKQLFKNAIGEFEKSISQKETIREDSEAFRLHSLSSQLVRFNRIMEELDLEGMDLDLVAKEIDLAKYSKRFLCYSCMESGYACQKE